MSTRENRACRVHSQCVRQCAHAERSTEVVDEKVCSSPSGSLDAVTKFSEKLRFKKLRLLSSPVVARGAQTQVRAGE